MLVIDGILNTYMLLSYIIRYCSINVACLCVIDIVKSLVSNQSLSTGLHVAQHDSDSSNAVVMMMQALPDNLQKLETLLVVPVEVISSHR